MKARVCEVCLAVLEKHFGIFKGIKLFCRYHLLQSSSRWISYYTEEELEVPRHLKAKREQETYQKKIGIPNLHSKKFNRPSIYDVRTEGGEEGLVEMWTK